MLHRLVYAIAGLLLTALAVLAGFVYFVSREVPVQRRTTAAAPPVKASAPRKSKGPPKPSPPPQIGPPGPDRDRQYSWAEVEAALAETRRARGTRPELWQRLDEWYNFLSDPKFTGSEGYPAHFEKLQAYAAASPQSPTPRVVLAKALLKAAWEDRGTGAKETASAEGLRLFHQKVAQAQDWLNRAMAIGVHDGEAHALVLEVCRIEGRSLAETRGVFEAGQRIDAAHLDLYSEMATYLLPRWHGQPGEMEKFAAEVAQMLPGDSGADAYIHIAYTMHQFDNNLVFWGDYDRQLLVRGAEVAVKRYPEARNLVPFSAICTMAAQDRAAARRIRPAVTRTEAPRVWLWKTLIPEFFRWCDSAEADPSCSQWIWGAPLNYPTITFAPDSQAVWCGTGIASTAVALWDLPTKKARLVLPLPDHRFGELAFDPRKNWVVATHVREQGAGWTLWNFTAPDEEPFQYATTEACRAIAIHPTLPQIAWAMGRQVCLLDMTMKTASQPFDTGDLVRSIRFSEDGKSLAVTTRAIAVWDVASGRKQFTLPGADDLQDAEFVVEKVLDFDSVGRIWAIGFAPQAQPLRRSVVRFAADGKTHDVVLADVAGQDPIQPLTAVLSPERRLLAVVSQSKPADAEVIHVWNLATGKAHSPGSHAEHIGGLAFSPDGKTLASVSQAGSTLRIWSLTQENRR